MTCAKKFGYLVHMSASDAAGSSVNTSPPADASTSGTRPHASAAAADPESGPSAFEKWRRNAMLLTGLGGVTDDERIDYLQERQRTWCEEKKTYLTQFSASYSSLSLPFLTNYLHFFRPDSDLHAQTSQSRGVRSAPEQPHVCALREGGGFNDDPEPRRRRAVPGELCQRVAYGDVDGA